MDQSFPSECSNYRPVVLRRLLHDVCRCHDSRCPDHLTCQRWVERNTGEAHTPHMETMR